MPGLVRRGQKRQSHAISDNESEQFEPSSSVSVGSKRARHARDASDSPIPSNSKRPRPQTQASRTDSTRTYVEDKFQPGSLVRVKLTNFVTYTAAEFHLGPSLNMVIGPNGTGKSTLVCAICLGLGWGSEHLGRAKELGAFVKHGAAEAEIEIELAAGPGMDTNPIIQRTIRKDDNKSLFLLNGKRAAQNAVTAMCKGLSIQIDNLCQFLPQDRVVEFAKMTDVDRLRETQRAAAPAYMVEWHDQLKVLRSNEKSLETKQRNEQGHLERLEKQQTATRDDVERWNQREGLLQKSRCLKKVKPIIEIRLRKKDIEQAKIDLRTARHKLDQINADVEPVRQAQDEIGAYQDQIEQVVKIRKNRVELMKTQADKRQRKIDADKLEVANFADQVKAEFKSKKERERDIIRISAEIKKLERQRDDQPVQYDSEAHDARKVEIRSQLSAAQNQLTELREVNSGLRSRAHDLNRESGVTRDRRVQLDTQSGKQASLLAGTSRDTATAWAWFQKNKDTLALKGEVSGPPLLECSIPDPRFIKAVESQLRKGDIVAITCSNGDDQKLLSNKFFAKQQDGGLGLHDVHLRTSPKPLSAYQPPVARENLARYGFEGYILDYIRGPDAVLAMLCDNTKIHQIAFATTAISDEQHGAVSGSGIRKWVSGNDIFQITVRREYNASSTSVTQLRRPQYFVEQPINTEQKRELDDKLKALAREAAELQENLRISKEDIATLDQKIQELKREKDEIQAEQDAMKKAVAIWATLPGKIGKRCTLQVCFCY